MYTALLIYRSKSFQRLRSEKGSNENTAFLGESTTEASLSLAKIIVGIGIGGYMLITFFNLPCVLENDEILSSLSHIPLYPMNEINHHYKTHPVTNLIAGLLIEINKLSRIKNHARKQGSYDGRGSFHQWIAWFSICSGDHSG